jgi:lysozyme family protein
MSFGSAVELLLGKEGGYANDRRDSGGETNWGLTIMLARAYGYAGSMREMARERAIAIYQAAFWDYMLLDLIEGVAPRVAAELFDTAVNQGTVAAGKYLQRALNVLNQSATLYRDIDVDGAVGPVTVAALRDFLRRRKPDGELVLLRALNCLQGAFYIELAEKRAKDEAFVYGWLRNRVEVPGDPI